MRGAKLKWKHCGTD